RAPVFRGLHFFCGLLHLFYCPEPRRPLICAWRSSFVHPHSWCESCIHAPGFVPSGGDSCWPLSTGTTWSCFTTSSSVAVWSCCCSYCFTSSPARRGRN